MSDPTKIDFTEFRKRIGDLRGREYWRSLEELSRSDAFGEISTWSDFLASLQPLLKSAATHPGEVRLLTQTISSPTLGLQIQQVLAKYPGVKWHQWDGVSRDEVREGLRTAFGSDANVVY